ncbi:hypothetical protein JCM10449v2_007243 [Rhodotorula kratochvilovae]
MYALAGPSGYEYTVALDRFYLGVTALTSIPLQAVLFAAAVVFKEPAVLLPGAAMNCIILTELVFWLGAGADFSIRNILITGLLGVWALHLFIFSIVHTCKSRQRGANAAQKRPVRLPLTVIVSYILFPWVLFLPFIISCSPPVSYAGDGGVSLKFKPYPSDIIGLVLMAIAFLVEIGAWYGKLRYDLKPPARATEDSPVKRDRASASILSHGIYTITRHPLLFAIPLLSLSIYLTVAAPGFYAWQGSRYSNRLESPGREALVASVVAPVAIWIATVLFIFPWLDRADEAHYRSLASERAVPAAEGNIWTAYEVYRARTSPILPLPPTLYRRLPSGVQRWVFAERPLDASAARRFGTRGVETGVAC